MAKIDRTESEILEFKRQWTDKALEHLAAFSDTRGGFLVVSAKDPYTPGRLGRRYALAR